MKTNYLKTNKFRMTNKGFTLVELVVVLLLMVILMSVALVGALGWIDYSNFQKENAAAEDIYYAAQNQLTELDSSGALENIVQDVLWDYEATPEYGEELPGNYNINYIIGQGKESVSPASVFSSLRNDEGNMYSWGDLWTDNNKATEKRTILSLRVKKNRYGVYLTDRSSVTKEERLLFDILAPYISDKSVLNGAIVLEFSPEAAQVFSVCYSDTAEELNYGSSGNITNRKIQNRWDSNIGYFGVDTLTRKIRGRGRVADNYTLMIHNSNSLDLVLKSNKVGESITGSDLSFTIKGSDKYNGNYSTIMTFTLDSQYLDNLNGIDTLQKAAKNPTPVKVVCEYGLYSSESSGQDYWMPIWRDTDGTINIALDAADVQAQSIQYAKTFNLLGNTDTEVETAKKDFRNTYSFYRFGLPGIRFIQAEVDIIDENTSQSKGTAISGDWVPSASNFKEYTAKQGAAVTFANHESGDEDNTFGISNARHLYNIRFESDYSDALKTTDEYDYLAEVERIYTLKNDIDWDVFTKNGSSNYNYFLNSKDNERLNQSMPSGTDYSIVSGINLDLNKLYPRENASGTYGISFPGFRMLSYSDKLISKEKKVAGTEVADQQIFKIKNLNISFGDNCKYGVYGTEVKSAFSDAAIDEFTYVSDRGKAGLLPLGLFAESFGDISDIELNNISVAGIEKYNNSYLFTSKVGGFVGENFGTVKNLLIDENLETGKKPSSVVRGRSDIGGIVGHQYYLATKKDDPSVKDAKIEGCINNAKVTGMGYVGGIIGKIYPEGKEEYDLKYSISTSGEVLFSNNYIKSIPNNPGKEDELFTKNEIETFTIEKCENHAEISIDEYFTNYDVVVDNNTFHRGFYYGGIVGAALNQYGIDQSGNNAIILDGSKKAVLVKDCTSYTLYTEAELKSILNPSAGTDQYKDTARRLRANFVGGVVGGCRYAFIENCSSAPSKEKANGKYSFVFGDRYIGGIAGYAVETYFKGDENYNIAELSKVTSFTEEEISNKTSDELGYRKNYNIINGTGAYGNYAVGGIAGSLGRPDGNSKYNSVSIDGYNSEYVRELLECSYSGVINGETEEVVRYSYPSGCGQMAYSNNNIHVESGLLNTAVVLGGSYNMIINKSDPTVTNNNSTCYQSGKLYYGVGGITGFLAVSINSADSIQTEDIKRLNLVLACLGTSTQNVSSASRLLDNMSVSTLTDIINNSVCVTDGVGGLVGCCLGTGNINMASGRTKYNSKIDTVVFGRNRVGGAVGDTEAINQRASSSAIANFYPSKINSGSSGLYVLGNDCVGGILGSYGDDGANLIGGMDPGYNSVDNYDNGTINKNYHVIGNRAVGGIIGLFASDDGKNLDKRKTIYGNINPSQRITVKGSMYVGGVVGMQERYQGEPARYYIKVQNVNISAECFSGGLVGALYSSGEFWQVDKMLLYNGGKEYYKNLTVNADIGAGFVAGLYAYNTNNKSVLSYKTNNQDAIDNFQFEFDSDKNRISRNGLSGIKAINELNYKNTDSLETSVNKIKGVYDIKPSDISISVSEEDEGMNFYNLSNYMSAGGTSISVSSKIYAAGLFGFTQSYCPVKVDKFRSRNKISTSQSIVSHEINDSDQNQYSYLGAITGKIPVGMIVDDCWNSSGDYKEGSSVTESSNEENYISSAASFKGGLAEINSGTVINCSTEYVKNSSDRNFIGRFKNNLSTGNMIGLNGTRDNSANNYAVVKNCKNYQKLEANVAGGIVASIGGYSQIIKCTNEGKITGKQVGEKVGVAGGIVGNVVSSNNSADTDYLILTNNVNAGSVTVNNGGTNDKSAGIIYDSNGLGVMNGCRNYGSASKYAISSTESGKTLKSMHYCFDGSGLAKNINDFGKINDDLPSEKMDLNFIVGTGDSTPHLAPVLTSKFRAYKYYLNDTSKTDISTNVLNQSTKGTHKKDNKWALNNGAVANVLCFDIVPASLDGAEESAYSNINTLGIDWDNYNKAEFNKYYNSIDENYQSSSYYAEFNPSDTSVPNYYNIAVDVYNNQTGIKPGYNSSGIAAYVNSASLDKFAFAVYMFMSDGEKNESRFISMLYDNAYFMSEASSKITVNFDVEITDIDGNTATLTNQSAEISGADYESKINVQGITQTPFNKSKVSKVVIKVNGLSSVRNDNEIGINGFYWIDGSSETADTISMDAPTSEVPSLFAGKTIPETLDILDSKNVSLTMLSASGENSSKTYSLNNIAIPSMSSLDLESTDPTKPYITLDNGYKTFIRGKYSSID